MGTSKSMIPQRLGSGSRLARRFLKYGFLVAAIALVSVASFISYCEIMNSVDVPAPGNAELHASFTRASAWVFRNSGQLLADNNSMLWLFVRDSARLSGDSKMLTLAQEYQSRYIQGTLARFFFDSSGIERVRDQDLHIPDSWPDYDRLLMYGATCNVSVGNDPVVLALLDPSACDHGLAGIRSPWCRTHQLMGLRFVQKNHCEPDAATAETVRRVQNMILAELTWDFRVEDAYIQKVLSLVESGRRDEVKAVWIRKILDAQRPDGGWDGVDFIARLPGDRLLCWQGGRLYPWVMHRPTSTFHATAQALYLLALLLQKDAAAGHSPLS